MKNVLLNVCSLIFDCEKHIKESKHILCYDLYREKYQYFSHPAYVRGFGFCMFGLCVVMYVSVERQFSQQSIKMEQNSRYISYFFFVSFLFIMEFCLLLQYSMCRCVCIVCVYV